MTEEKRFTTRRDDKVFWIDDDKFIAVGKLDTNEVLDLAKRIQHLQDEKDQTLIVDELTAALLEFFEHVLREPSFKLLKRRMRAKVGKVATVDRIDLTDLLEVVQYLTGDMFGARPTMPPGISPGAHNGTGTVSTAGARPAASTR